MSAAADAKTAPTPTATKPAKKAPKEEQLCPICLDPFTGTIRKAVACGQCKADTCSKCVEKYLLNTIEDPHCPHCRYAWPRSFLNTICTSTFLNKTYYKYRQDILMNRERSYLPEMMVHADRELRARKVEREYSLIAREEREVYRAYEIKMAELATKRNRLMRKATRIRGGHEDDDEEVAAGGAGAEPKRAEARKFVRRCTADSCKGFLSSVWKCGVCENWVCPECFEVKGKEKDVVHTCKPEMLETAKLIKKDTKPCPSCGEMIMKIEGCFAENTPVLSYDGSIILSQNIKVGDTLIGDDGEARIVDRIVSGKDQMYEVSQTNGITYMVNSKHKLALKSFNDIIEITIDEYLGLPESKREYLLGYKSDNTTSKITVKSIGTGTYYGWSVTGGTNKRFVLEDFTVVRNCDQMWCISCHTPFSWQSGQIVTTGTIHNPHYYQWMRNGGGGHMPQHPGHIPCGGLPDPYNVRRSLRLIAPQDLDEFLGIYRTCVHMIEVERNRYQRHVMPQNNRDLDIRFLLNEIDEETWKTTLAKEEKDRQKSREIREILDAFNGATIDIMRRIDNRAVNPYSAREGLALVLELRTELNALRDYIVDELMKVSKAFNCSVPYIDDEWGVRHGSAATVRRNARAAAAAAQAPANGGAGAPVGET
jgi:hypothetical protein